MEHPGDCTKYFDCRDKNQMIKECTYPKLYSPTQQACLDFQDVQCNGRREYKAPCEYTLTCTKDQPSPTSWVILNIFQCKINTLFVKKEHGTFKIFIYVC